MVDKITWIGTGWRKLFRKDDSYGKYPVIYMENLFAHEFI
jgi:hypothetical protein